MIGIITTPLVFIVVMVIFSFFLELLIINLTARFMEFKDTTWKTAARISILLVLFTLIYSLLITYLNLFSMLTQVLGVILFVILLYKLITKIHKEESTRQKTGYCFLVKVGSTKCKQRSAKFISLFLIYHFQNRA